MYQLSSKIIGLPVVTESGLKIGKVCDLQLDIEDWRVQCIYVRSRMFGKEDLVIGVEQIVRVEAKQIMVRDGTVPSDASPEKGKNLAPVPVANLSNRQGV